jgi:hypothetical protein
MGIAQRIPRAIRGAVLVVVGLLWLLLKLWLFINTVVFVFCFVAEFIRLWPIEMKRQRDLYTARVNVQAQRARARMPVSERVYPPVSKAEMDERYIRWRYALREVVNELNWVVSRIYQIIGQRCEENRIRNLPTLLCRHRRYNYQEGCPSQSYRFTPHCDDSEEKKDIVRARLNAGRMKEVVRRGTRATKNTRKNREYHISGVKMVAPVFEDVCFDDPIARVYGPVPKVFKPPIGNVFDEPFHRGVLLNAFLMDLKFEDVPMLLGSYKGFNPTKFLDKKHKLNFLNFKRSFNEIRYVWNLDLHGVEKLKEFLATSQIVAPEVKLRGHDYVLPTFVKLDQHPLISFPDFPKKHFEPVLSSKGVVKVPPLVTQSFVPNVLYDILLKCDKHSHMMSVQKIKSICRQKILDHCTKDELLEVISNKCYMWRNKDDNPNYSKMSWFVPFIKAEWLYYDITDEKRFLLVFREMLLELRSTMLRFAGEYFEYSLLTPSEQRVYKANVTRTFRNTMRAPDIQERFASGESKKSITDDIYLSSMCTIKDCASNTVEVLNCKKLKVRVKRKIILKERRLKIAEQNVWAFNDETFEPHLSVESVIIGSGFLFFSFVIAIVVVFKPWWDKNETVITKCLNDVGRIVSDTRRTSDAVIKTIDGVDSVVADLMKMFSSGMKAEHQVIAVEIKTIAFMIYHVIHGDIQAALYESLNLVLMHPDKIKDLVEAVATFSTEAMTRVQEVSFHIGKQLYTVGSDVFADLLRKSDAGEDIDPPMDQFTPHMKTFDFLAPFTSIFTLFGAGDLSLQEMKDATTRFQYLFYNERFWKDKLAMFKGVVSYIGREFFDYDPFDVEHSAFTRDITEMIVFIDDCILNEPNLVVNLALCKEIMRKFEVAKKLHLNIRMDTLTNNLRGHFQRRFLKLEALAVKADSIINGLIERITPLAIMFTGSPNTGKSAMLLFFMKYWCFLSGVEYSAQETYTYKTDSPYWDGFAHQRFVCIDDIFKEVDVAIRVLIAAAVISMINTVAYALNVAECEAKGKLYFNTDVLLMSTNVANNGVEKCNLIAGLEDNRAFWRRVHIVVHAQTEFTHLSKPETMRYRVDVCTFGPEFVNRWYTGADIVKIARKCRERQIILGQQYHYSTEKLAEIDARVTVHSDFSELMERFNQYVKIIYPQNREQVVNFFRGFMVLMGLATTGIGLYVLSQKLCITDKSVVDAHSHPGETYDYKTQHARKRKGAKKKVFEKSRVTFRPHADVEQFVVHGSEDSFIQCCTKLCSTLVYLEVQTNSGQEIGHSLGFHLKDGFIVATAHGTERFYGYDYWLKVSWIGGFQRFPFPTELMKASGEDLVIFTLEHRKNCPKAMYNYIVEQEQVVEITAGSPMKVLTLTSDACPSMIAVNKAPGGDAPVRYPRTPKPDEPQYVVDFPIAYFGDLKKGQSGGPVVIEGPQGRPYVVGFHVGDKALNGNSWGIALPFTKESFDGLLEDSEDYFTPHFAGTFPFEIHSIVPEHMASYPPNKNDIKPSKMFGWCGDPVKLPSRMHTFVDEEGNLVNPVMLAISKYSQAPEPEMQISERFDEYFLNLYPPIEGSRVLTIDEAINGDPIRGIPSIKHSSSPGWPFKLTGTGGKNPFITRVGDRMEPSSWFLAYLLSNLAKLEKGEQIDVVFADCLKIETLKLVKVKAGKTRGFATCPLHYLIIARMYFLDFAMYVQSKAATHPISVGIDVHSIEWTMLYRRISEGAKSFISGDFTNFDATIRKVLVLVYLRIVNKWYNDGPVNAEIRRLLVEHIWSSKHILYDVIYMLSCGNPSGNPFTSIVNSVCLMCILYYIFVEVMGMRETDFMMAVYGDDNLVGLKVPGITVADLAPLILEHFGMVYTHSLKGRLDVVDTMSTISYLGRTFRLDNSVVRAPLDERVIIESTYWYSKTNESLVAMSTAQSFMIEASHLPYSRFCELRELYFRAVRDRMPELYEAIREQSKTYWYYYESMYVTSKRVHFDMHSEFTSHCCVTSEESCKSWDTKPIVVQFPEQNVSESRNEDMTHRGPNEAGDTQTNRLGAMRDINPTEYDATPGQQVQGIHESLNMEVHKMSGNFLREYLVGSFTITSSMATNTQIGVLNFPQALTNIPFINAMIHYFKHFRAGVRVSVRPSCTSFDYGVCMMDWYPYKLSVDTNTNDIYDRSGREHWLIPYETSGAVTADFKFLHPYRAMDTFSMANDEIGCLTFTVVSPLTNIQGTTESITLVVTAQFIEPEAWYPYYLTALTAIKEDEDGEFVEHAHMEATMKSKNNSYSKDFEANISVGGNLTAPRIAAGIRSSVRRGLDKPTLLDQQATPRIDYLRSDFFGRGYSDIKSGGNDPENAVTTDPVVFNPGVDETLLSTISGTPQMTSVFSIFSTTVPFIVENLNGNGRQTYDKVLQKMHSFHSGGYKHKIYFSCTSMQSMRVVFYYAPAAAAATGTIWQYCYHEIVEVSGSTVYETTTAYPNVNIMATTNDSTFALWCCVLNFSQPIAGATSPIYAIVYEAAAEDRQYSGLLDQCYNFTPASYEFETHFCPREDFKRPFHPLHESMSLYRHKGVVCGEMIENILDAMHVMWPGIKKQTGSGSEYFLPPWVYASSNTINGVPMFNLFYLFCRGSLRVKIFDQTTATNNTNSIGLFLRTSAGNYYPTFDCTHPTIPTAGLTMPFFTAGAFVPIRTGVAPNLPKWSVLYPTTTNYVYPMIGAADDYTPFYIFPFPAGTFQGSNGNIGFAGLASYMST